MTALPLPRRLLVLFPLTSASLWGCLKVPELLKRDLWWLLFQYFPSGLAEFFSLDFSRQLEPVLPALSPTVFLVRDGFRSHSESEEREDVATAAASACSVPFNSRRPEGSSLLDSASSALSWKSRGLEGRGHQAPAEGWQQQMHLPQADEQQIAPAQQCWKCGQQGGQSKQRLARLHTAQRGIRAGLGLQGKIQELVSWLGLGFTLLVKGMWIISTILSHRLGGIHRATPRGSFTCLSFQNWTIISSSSEAVKRKRKQA